MRVGDFVVEVVPHGSGKVRELDTGHVLARPGQVYHLRLRNMGPLYCVANVSIDDSVVTANGLVLAPWSTTDLERPIHDAEHGRFTVFAEGDETVFGPDGGRDNPALGLIEAKFRRELPRERDGRRDLFGTRPSTARPLPVDEPLVSRGRSRFSRSNEAPPSVSAIATRSFFGDALPSPLHVADDVERAAGTGLTGHSDQRFVPMNLGPLESEATTIRLRLVIGTDAAIAEQPARPLPDLREPAGPAARP
jgi:hypothetical protein